MHMLTPILLDDEERLLSPLILIYTINYLQTLIFLTRKWKKNILLYGGSILTKYKYMVIHEYNMFLTTQIVYIMQIK